MTEVEKEFLAAINGDSAAFSAIFSRYQPIVLKLMKKYYLKDFEWQDWLQEGRIICYESLKVFDHNKGITFGSFFKLNLERRIFSLLRKQEAVKRKIDRESYSLDEKIEQLGEKWLVREEMMDARGFAGIFIRDHLKKFHNELSSFEMETFLRHLKGQTSTEIAKALVCPVGKVKNGIDRVRIKFKNQLYK